MYAMDKCTVVTCALGGALRHLLSVTCNIVLPRVNNQLNKSLWIAMSQPAFLCHSITKSYLYIIQEHNINWQ